MQIIGFLLLGAFMNTFVRGGWWKSLIFKNKPPFDIPGADWINAGVWGAFFAYLAGAGWQVALWASFCMFCGASPGWGEYIGAMLGQREYGSKRWGVMMMTLRGGFWGFCLSLAAIIPAAFVIIPNCALFASVTILGGLTQGLVYYLLIKLVPSDRGNYAINHWSLSEIVFSPFLWVIPFSILIG